MHELVGTTDPNDQGGVGGELPEHTPLFPRETLTRRRLCRHTSSVSHRLLLAGTELSLRGSARLLLGEVPTSR